MYKDEEVNTRREIKNTWPLNQSVWSLIEENCKISYNISTLNAELIAVSSGLTSAFITDANGVSAKVHDGHRRSSWKLSFLQSFWALKRKLNLSKMQKRPPGLMICWKFEYSRHFWKTTDSDLIGRKSCHRTSFWHSDNPKCKGKEPVNYLFGNAFLELCVIIVFEVFYKVWKSEKGES